MKTTRYSILVMLIALFCMSVEAQQRNVLKVSDVTTQVGNVQLPVTIENTDEIVGAQFDLTLPNGVTAQSIGILTSRNDGHSVTVSQLSNGAYRVLLHSGQNRPLLGQSGIVMYLPIIIPDSYEEGSEHQLSISNAILGKASGENVLTETVAGKIRIAKLPDITVKNVTVDKQTLSPGGHLVCSWQVENIGELATSGGWSEQLSLVNIDGSQSKLIATKHYDNILNAKDLVSRQTEVSLPFLLGIDGQVKLQVRIVPDSDAGESSSAQANNTQLNAAALTVNKLLSIELSPKRISESSNQHIAFRVNRSGQWSTSETFAVSATADSRVSVPTSITIPANQSGAVVYIKVTDNDVLDNDSIIEMSVEGNGYDAVKDILIIEDNEYPDLGIVASPSVMTEGDTFQLTITASRVSAKPIVVTLTSENTKRFKFPQMVTIPAGETSAKVTVETIDDELPGLDLSNAFTVSAPNYNKSEAIVLLQDNDMPVLELQLTPNTVSESAGVVAVSGVLKRTTKTDSKITVKLMDDADGGLYFGNRTLELAKGVKEIHFNFGPVDNNLVDGDRIYTITAAVWLSSCSCNATGESAGYVTTQLKVLDNDGPALGLASSLSTVKEGGKATLTISRNTKDTSLPLTVTLSSDYEEGLTYDHTVIIPAGEQTVKVEIASAANTISGDSHTVVFTAQTESYSSGTCYIMITDQTLPDARINSIAANVSEAEVGTKAKLTIEVVNEGATELPAETVVKIYHRGEGSAIGTLFTSEPIAIGGSQIVTKTITLPTTVGSHSYYAVVNESNTVSELSFTNNTSSEVSITTTAPFSVTVNTDKKVYKQGEKIFISGQLTGHSTANTAVDLYVINEGVRQVKSITTDADGAFTCEWELYALQSGHFIAGACYPNEGLNTEMASFDVYGLKRVNFNNITCDVIKGDTHTGSLDLINLGNLSLTEVNAEVLSAPSNCEASLTIPSTIEGGTTVQMFYSLKGTEVTAENKWDEVKARINTKEGVSLDVTLYFYCRNASGKLRASTNSLNTTMIKGKSREYSLKVTNIGRGNTGKITLALPEFMKSLAGNTLPALNQNDTITIPLAFTPTENMQLNVPVTGRFGINCENGEGTYIDFSITPVSEDTGKLLVDVCDEYTYYTNETPHVEGAEVVLRNSVTNALIAQGHTDASGMFSITLPEGYYNLSVTADNHDSYTNNIYVDPGVETKKVINLSTKAITVDWKVEETEVEDEYKIVTTVTYETNVPAPVVELTIPNKIDVDQLPQGESLIFTAVLTNKGLIAAQDAELILPESFTHITFEPLVQYTGLTIAPQQSVFIPVKVTKNSKTSTKALLRANIDNDPCVGYPGTLYFWDCGLDRKWHRYDIALQLGSCNSNDPSTWNNGYGDGYGGGSGYGGGGGGYIAPPGGGGGSSYGTKTNNNRQSITEDKGCEPCQNGILIAGAKCASHFIGDAVDTLKGIFDLGGDDDDDNDTDGPDDVFDNAFDRGTITGDMQKALYDITEHLASSFDACAKVSPNFDDVYHCYKEASETVDALFEDAVTNTLGHMVSKKKLAKYKALGKKIMKVKKWIDLAADCAYDFVHACDHLKGDENGNASQSLRLNATENPDFTTTVLANLDVVNTRMTAFSQINDVLWGESPYWDEVTFGEMEILMDSVDYVNQPYSEVQKYKPEDLPESEFQAFYMRMHSYLSGNVPAEVQETLEDNVRIMHETREHFALQGYDTPSDYTKENVKKLWDNLQESQSSVCASIKLEFKQTMTITRQAFRGTLTVFNGNEDTAMRDVKLMLNVSNQQTGDVATAHEFQINAESLEGFTGDLELGSGWTLAANEKGTATILFTPTKYAAPTEPVEWSFGGTLSYTDPFTGLEVTRELYPVTLTVKPSPDLDLTYFMQRDIYGDDPLTRDVVEPMRPAEFALLINNKGNGDATNVHMVTQQPEIIDNEKGLAIDFELVSSQVNGQDAALSFGQSIANDFGNIPAHSQKYAQWWLTSTLLGHFTDYKVEASHVTSYGNKDLSLLDQVTIHELIHGFDMPKGSMTGGPENGRAFLVNDIPDANDLPDRIYFSNSDTDSVSIATAKIHTTSTTTCLLTVTPSAEGWNYGSLLDPTHGYAELKSIVRQSDGAELCSTQFWQTDRTLRDGKDWLYENRLHFVDDFSSTAPVTYLLTFAPIPQTILEVTSIETVPEEGKIAEEPINNLTVHFNKPVNVTTFTDEDIIFAVQGVKQDASKITISTDDNMSFKLDMAAMNESLPNGYYTLAVQTANITDQEGFTGRTGSQVGWILFRGGLVQLQSSVWPKAAGTVTRRTENSNNSLNLLRSAANTAKYGSKVTFVAEASYGYEFSNWTLNGEVVSTDTEYSATLLNDVNLVANFTKKMYKVEIAKDIENGSITGMATGIYDHGIEAELTATADEDYRFKCWTVNGETIASTDEVITLTINNPMTISAVFEREYYNHTMTLSQGWNWISSYISEALPIELFEDNVNRIIGQFDELISDPEYGLVGGLNQLTAGSAYKVEASQNFTTNFRGHLLTIPITLKKGWNWVAYPWIDSKNISDAVINAEEGDYMVSQRGFTEFAEGQWEGTLRDLSPGEGYLYKSASDKTLSFNYLSYNRSKRLMAMSVPVNGVLPVNVDIHRYPNTMNMTIQVYKDEVNRLTDNLCIYAFAGEELRGVSQQIGNNHYLTVYGDGPEDISFVVESALADEVFAVNETLMFCDDILGNRKNPFILHISNATGVDSLVDDEQSMTIYSIEGILISRDASYKMLKELPKGIYIVNGRKCFIK